MARILCVDDDPAALTLRRVMLENAGHTVDVSTSATDAVAKLASASYDAVVTDWRLGNASALGVIQAAKLGPDIPVIVVSGCVTEAFQTEGPDADLYLDKPVDPSQLIAILETLLHDRNTGPPWERDKECELKPGT